MTPRFRRIAPGAALAALALALYVPTWCPVVTWAHLGDDGPELETVGRIFGVAHPTGYPLLTLLVHVVSRLVPPPVSALNVVTLLAATAAVVAAGYAGRAAGRRLFPGEPRGAWLAGFAGAAFFAVSLSWWKQAVIGEVYPLHLALMTAALALVFAGGPRRGLLAAWCLGLGLANHLQTVPFLMVVAAYLFFSGRRRPRLAVAAALLAPLTLYLVPLLRARQHPALDWGDPETLRGIGWMISGSAYRGYLFRNGLSPFLERLADALLHGPAAQITAGGAALAAVGAAVGFRRAPREAAALVLLYLGSTVVGAAYAVPDPVAYYLPANLALGLFAGMGAAWVLASALRSASLRGLGRVAVAAGAVAATASILIFAGARAWPRADVHRDRAALDYARGAMAALPPGALVLAHGDGRTFSLWYGALVLDPRPDVVILYDNLLDWPWYRRLLAERNPHLPLPPTGLSRPVLRGAILERFLEDRPVYVTELEPELASLFTATPAGPLYRVARGPRSGVTAAASTDRKRTDTPTHPTVEGPGATRSEPGNR